MTEDSLLQEYIGCLFIVHAPCRANEDDAQFYCNAGAWYAAICCRAGSRSGSWFGGGDAERLVELRRRKIVVRLVGLSLLAATFGSVLGAVLFYFSLSALSLWTRGIPLNADCSLVFLFFPLLFSLPFTIPTTTLVGVPIAYRFRQTIVRKPIATARGFTLLGAICSTAAFWRLFHAPGQGDWLIAALALPVFGGSTAFVFAFLIARFGTSLGVASAQERNL